MKTSNRDLLVLTRSAVLNKQEMDEEVQKLHALLFETESLTTFCVANEIIDIDRYKIISKPAIIQKMIAKRLKPFQFVNNKN